MSRVIIKGGKFPPLTEEQKKEIRDARNRPINYEDIPPLTEEQLSRMKRVNSDKSLVQYSL